MAAGYLGKLGGFLMNDAQRTLDIMIVDDQPLVLDGLTRIVDAQPDMRTIGSARNGRDAVDQVRALQPDVVLMDIRMPILNGIEATRTIISDRVSPNTRILGLTTYDTDASAIGMLRAGAIGFVLKDSTTNELVDAIRAAYHGTFITTAASTSKRLLDRLAAREPSASANTDALTALTDRERVVFDLVVAGYSNPEISGQLFIAEVTVKTHVGHILTKLGVRDRIHLVIWAHRHGLADTPSELTANEVDIDTEV